MHKPRRKSPEAQPAGLAIAGRLIGLVAPMLPLMLVAVAMGVAGFLCAIFITVLGAYALLAAVGVAIPFSLGFIFAAILLMALLRGLLRYAEQAANHYIAFRLLAHIRDRVYRALRRLAPAKLETKDRGNLISLITTDVELLEVFYAHTISPVAIAVVVCGLMAAFLAGLHWLFATLALCGYFVVGLALPLLVSRLGRNAGTACRAQSGALGSTVLDSLRGLREVLQFGQGQARLAAIEEQTRALGEKQREIKRCEGLAAALSNTAILLFSLAVLVCGILLNQRGAVEFSAVLIAFVATIGSFGPVVALASLSGSLLQTLASAGRVLNILDEEPVTQEVTDGLDVDYSGMACRELGFAYGSQPVLHNVNLNLEPGRIVGIQGESGSGKSTLLRLLMRFWDADKGRVTMSGRNVGWVNTACLRKNQGFVTQDTVLFNDSIENNVKVANLSATHSQVEQACRKAAIHEFIAALPHGYDTGVGELGDRLSGGERQRIGLARAFLHNAPMILLDEPTSNLDSLNEGIILHSLQEESGGKTVVLVSHRASSLGIADKVVRLEHGRCRG